MRGVTKEAKRSNGSSQRCGICCPIWKRDKICSPEIMRVCSDSFIDGFKKGSKWTENKLKKG